ncbi:MAG TPA: hypothetical protein VHX38_01220 [Pseudonocardiaceae bacterium]|jgi:hypothetical protein|nr:hypothetical protein [Pseudonocardiaceae bacterium]
MSGPYPPQGYPQQPGQGGWSGGQPTGGVPTGQYGPPGYEFPAVGYGGLSGQGPAGQGLSGQGSSGQDHGNWHSDQGNWNSGLPPTPQQSPRPPRKRNTGQIIVAVIAALVIVGGVATGILLLNNRHQQQQASPPPATSTDQPTATGQQNTGSDTPTGSDTGNSANGITTLSVAPGECVTATVAGQQYSVTQQATCGSANSDFILDKAVTSLDGCSVHQYVVVQGTGGTVYCFTLDIKANDCVDINYLKVPCAGAAFTVISTEAGPGGSDSCKSAPGANHWLPAGREPVQIACIGPPTS